MINFNVKNILKEKCKGFIKLSLNSYFHIKECPTHFQLTLVGVNHGLCVLVIVWCGGDITAGTILAIAGQFDSGE